MCFRLLLKGLHLLQFCSDRLYKVLPQLVNTSLLQGLLQDCLFQHKLSYSSMQGNTQDYSLHQNRLLLVFPSRHFRPCSRLFHLPAIQLCLFCNLRHYQCTMQDRFCYEQFLRQGQFLLRYQHVRLLRQLYHFMESHLQTKLFRFLRQSLQHCILECIQYN